MGNEQHNGKLMYIELFFLYTQQVMMKIQRESFILNIFWRCEVAFFAISHFEKCDLRVSVDVCDPSDAVMPELI